MSDRNEILAALSRASTLATDRLNISNITAQNFIGNVTSAGNLQVGNLSVISNAVVQGNLEVQGTTTTVNANTLTLIDKYIILANGATTESQANGAGIVVAAGNIANFIYLSASNSWVSSHTIVASGIDATGNITTSANISASYVLGNGAFLSGLGATYSNANVANYLPEFGGNANVGNLLITGDIFGNANVTGYTNITGNVNALANLNVTSNAYFSTNTFTSGYANVTGNVNASSNLNVTNNAYFSTNTFTSGYANVAGNVNALANLNVTANAVFSSNTFTSGYANITGNVNASSNLNVTANAVFSSNALVAGYSNIAGNVNASSNLNVTANAVFSSNALVAGYSNIAGNVNALANLNVTNNAVFSSNTFTSGYANVAGNINALANLNVTANGRFSSNVIVAGYANVTGNVNATGNVVATANVVGANGIFTRGSTALSPNLDEFIKTGSNTSGVTVIGINSANSQYSGIRYSKVGVERWFLGADNSSANGAFVLNGPAGGGYFSVTDGGGNIRNSNITALSSIVIGNTAGTTPLYAADAATGTVSLTPGLQRQALLSGGVGRSPYWSSIAPAAMILNGNVTTTGAGGGNITLTAAYNTLPELLIGTNSVTGFATDVVYKIEITFQCSTNPTASINYFAAFSTSTTIVAGVTQGAGAHLSGRRLSDFANGDYQSTASLGYYIGPGTLYATYFVQGASTNRFTAVITRLQ